ncbi:hypothetical protein [Synechococcus sp. BA-132 BA5]|uniref:hypothetical protein n=1 Tax=Synechococcus sp. BA-132 BA5 TaxID=3110252 RepID=UPI002B21F75E|nr:hypothetical protein [Synechococcus sp. BA-132 BA5]MEA5416605.1 hypothetical protein [Synechococcus sp. BA-132 BA5]
MQRKAVTLCKRDQKRGGTGNVQQYRLAIHDAVLASEGCDHWTGEPLDWQLIRTYDNNETAARKGAHKKQYAMLPTIDHRTLPLSGRQEAIAIEADSTAACPLQGLVRRCRIFTSSVCGPTPHLQSSRHLRFTSHTGAQLQPKGRDNLQDGVKARTTLSR